MNKDYKKTTSAGGVIVKLFEEQPRVLVLVTKAEGKGFLPKGHVEGKETLEEAALREVREEAGLKNLEIVTFLGKYNRLVDKVDIKEDKTIHYFLMKPMVDNEKHEPIEDSSNIDFKWCPLDDLPEMYLEENRDVIEKNITKIKNHLV